MGPARAPGQAAGGRVAHADRRFSARYLSPVSRRSWAREGARDDPQHSARPRFRPRQ
jgi:hypothetical protein